MSRKMEKFLRPEKIKRFLDQKKLKDFWNRKNQKIFRPSQKKHKRAWKNSNKKRLSSVSCRKIPTSMKNHERLQYFFSSFIAISKVLPWQYEGYSHGNFKATSMAILWLLPSTSFSRTNSSCRASSNNNHIPAFCTISVSLKKTKQNT